jgi:hypothetical protein
MKPLMLVAILSAMVVAPACTVSSQEADVPSGTYETRTSQGDVSFRLTPRRSSGRLIVDIQADTHTGDLADLNLRDVVRLHVGEQAYDPAEATRLAGHHSEASVTFDVSELPEHFSIKISGVRDVETLTFEWP